MKLQYNWTEKYEPLCIPNVSQKYKVTLGAMIYVSPFQKLIINFKMLNCA